MKSTFLKYFFFLVLFLLIFQGTGRGERFSWFEKEVGEMTADSLEVHSNEPLFLLIKNAPDDATRIRYSNAWNHLDLAELPSKLDPTVLTKLGDDLLDADFATFLDGGVGRVKAWEKLHTHPQLRIDHDIIESLSKVIDDEYLKTLNIDQVITNKWVQHGFGCPTCISGSKPWINEIIDQLDHFKQYQNVDGYQTVLNQLLNQGKTQAIGSHWVMKYTKQKNLTPYKFEDFIDETLGDFSADIIVKLPDDSNKFIECKSWGSKAPNMSNVPNQMINYFNTQTSLTKFEFQFDPTRWVPTPTDLNQALKANTNLFDTNKWSSYQQMFEFTNEIPFGNFDMLVDHITSVHFNNLINP